MINRPYINIIKGFVDSIDGNTITIKDKKGNKDTMSLDDVVKELIAFAEVNNTEIEILISAKKIK